MASEALAYQDYTVGWVCALEKELAAATVMLDKRHPDLPKQANDPNAYTLGSIGDHNVAIACLPKGDIGNNPAAIVATRMTNSFPSIRFWLMVGIGGGVPPKVRLGDVVVSTPVYDFAGVVQWDIGIAQQQGFRRIGVLDKPPEVLRSAIAKLEAHREINGSNQGILHILEGVRSNYQSFASRYMRSEHLEDNLFRSDFDHVDQSPKSDNNGEEQQKGEEGDEKEEEEEEGEGFPTTCQYCDRGMLVKRKPRGTKMKTHYGVVASGNSVVKNARKRDEINQQLGGHALCFEMEAAGISNSHPCLVIRGICDYADTHKNYSWQRYAAVVAAAFAKELLGFVASNQVNKMPSAAGVLNELKDLKHTMNLNIEATQKMEMDSVLSRIPLVYEAVFDSFHEQSEPMCHPETRTALLCEIADWALDSQSKCIFWLNGRAGTGKSTISRTVAHDFARRQHLAASFFFKRGERDRGNASKFFTTIAIQLAQSLPQFGLSIKKAIDMDPTIFTKDMVEQFDKLIFEPLTKFQCPLNKLVVIDALDECENEDHIVTILRLLAQIQYIESNSLRFFVTSRPDLPLRLGFRQTPESHRDFILHEIPLPTIEHDIGAYLRDELPKIRGKYNCIALSSTIIPSDWPTERDTQALIKMAVPLFIFAATVCRFIGQTDWDWDPKGKLAKFLHSQSIRSLTQLGKTYLPVLTQILKGEITTSEKDRRIEEFRDIVGSIVVLFEPLSTSSLATTLGTSRTFVDNRLHRLHSVLSVPADPYTPVRLFHLSFRDFLLDPQNRKENPFWVDESQAHRKLTDKFLRLMSSPKGLRQNICNLPKPGTLITEIDIRTVNKKLPTELQYACRYWVSHLQRSERNTRDNDEVHSFLKKHALHWLEAMSLLGEVTESINILGTLQSCIDRISGTTMLAFVQDITRFALWVRPILHAAPLQLYLSGLTFAPGKSITRKLFDPYIPRFVQRLSAAVKEDWDTLLQTFEGHSEEVCSLTFSPNGTQLASGSYDQTIKLWDVVTGGLLRTLKPHIGAVLSITFSPDGTQLASGSYGLTMKLWDAVTGILDWELEGHLKSVSSFSYSPDGTQLVSGSDDETIRLWDIANGSHLMLHGHSGAVRTVAFSPDGTQLASGSNDRTIKLWDVATGSQQWTLEAASALTSVKFSPDGMQLASTAQNQTVKLWNVATGSLQWALEGHSALIEAVTFSPDGTQLASSAGHEIMVWDAATGSLQRTLEFESQSAPAEPVKAAVFSPDGTQLASASGDGIIRLWNAATRNLQQTFKGHSGLIESVVFSPNSTMLASCSEDRTVKLWDTKIARGSLQRTFECHSDLVRCIVLSPDGSQLASGSLDGTVKLWDAATGSLQRTLKSNSDSAAVYSVTFSSDGAQLASGYWNDKIMLWDVTMGSLQRLFAGHTGPIYTVTFSPDGMQLASGSDDHTIKLWNVATGDLQLTLESHSSSVRSVNYSHNGMQLASGSEDYTIKLWDVVTGNLQRTLEGYIDVVSLNGLYMDGACSVTFSPDGMHLVTKERVINLVDDGAHAAAFHPDTVYPLLVKEEWILRGAERILWLPSEYRAECFDVKDNQMVLGHHSGQITLLRFDFSALNRPIC